MNWLKKMRRKSGLSQFKFAALVGYSPRQIIRYEMGYVEMRLSTETFFREKLYEVMHAKK